MGQTASGPIRVSPTGTRTAVPLGPDRLGILYHRAMWERDRITDVVHYLDVFTNDGQYLGSAIVPVEEKVRGVAATVDGKHVFVSTPFPFPRVVKFRLVER